MFESAGLDHKVAKEAFEKQAPQLRQELLNAQFDLVEAKSFPVIILIAGFDGDGKATAVNGLNEVLDVHDVITNGIGDPTDEEMNRPWMWRFWRLLPPKGKIGIFFGSWYSEPVQRCILKKIKFSKLNDYLDEINRFEKLLADEGALVLKFWFHLSKSQQKQRLKKIKENPGRHWRLADQVLDDAVNYNRALTVAETVIRQTSTGYAPWIVIGGTDKRYRALTIRNTLLTAIRKRLDNSGQDLNPPAPVIVPPVDSINVLDSLDLSRSLERDRYKNLLEKYQMKLHQLSRRSKFSKKAVIAVFEGNDAAGKGGAIRRCTEALDATQYRVGRIAAPTEEERLQPYLWRFWRRIPRPGGFAFFDRSWYGRVLVERVEGFCSESDWLRAYHEINDFEAQLNQNDIVVIKFWLSISEDEQYKRFKAREETGYKRHKLTEDDWRNREKWGLYVKAICDMVDRTSTRLAPWVLVEAENKYYSRVKVLKALCQRIEDAF